jgi:PEP-CTERM/exosortase A-associated glycosyltransferase
MKVLHVLDHSIPLHDGYSFRTRNILIHQRQLGIDTCHITSPKHGEVEAAEEVVEGFKFYRSELPKEIYGGFKAQFEVVKKLEKRLMQAALIEKPNVLHAHSPALNGLAAIRVGKKLGIPVVYEIRAFWEDAAVDNGQAKEWGLRYRLTRWLESYVMKKVQHITCICEGLRSDIVARGNSPDKVTVIPNGVNISEFKHIDKPDPEIQQRLNLDGKFVVGFIGSFYALEGIDLLLRGFKKVLEQTPNLCCVIVGGGKEESLLKALVNELDLTGKVIFTGRVPHSEVERYYSIIDLLLYPRKSKRITELVTPLKPLEAMAMGREFAASNVGGHRELVTHGENGFLFNADDVDAIAQTIIEAMSREPAVRTLVREQAFDYVQNVRNWSNSVAPYPKIYQLLVMNCKT